MTQTKTCRCDSRYPRCDHRNPCGQPVASYWQATECLACAVNRVDALFPRTEEPQPSTRKRSQRRSTKSVKTAKTILE